MHGSLDQIGTSTGYKQAGHCYLAHVIDRDCRLSGNLPDLHMTSVNHLGYRERIGCIGRSIGDIASAVIRIECRDTKLLCGKRAQLPAAGGYLNGHKPAGGVGAPGHSLLDPLRQDFRVMTAWCDSLAAAMGDQAG